MKKILVLLLKIGISLAIVGYLIYDATRGKDGGNVFTDLVNQPKQWGLLAAAWAFCALAVMLTFVRWWRLVRALDVPCRFADALRISFWGYLFNLAPLGIVGGDLVKAVMLDHMHRGHRAKAIASVLVDRVIGLYLLFIVASAAIWLTGFSRIEQRDIQWICRLTYFITLASTAGLAVVMGMHVTGGRGTRLLGRVPRVGPPLLSLIEAVRMYNRKPWTLCLASLMTVGVHGSFALGCYLIACGLPGNHLTLAEHFVVIPLSSATGVLPLPMGPFEYVLEFLYTNVPVAGPAVAVGQGLVVALAYRLITVSIAALGVYFYFGSRREMAEVIHEAEQE